MYIDVKIPYKPDDLAGAYNRAMEDSSAPWVLLLDHDVFLALNPHWYTMLVDVVNMLEADNNISPGLITCVMNGCEGRPQQPDCEISKSSDLTVHIDKAYALYKKYNIAVKQAETPLIAGYFMLVNRKVWEKEKFKPHKGKSYKVDQWFCERIMKKGCKIYVMQGLYVYHRRGVRKLNWKG